MRLYTEFRLRQWGKYARGGLPSLPTINILEKARIGPGGHPDTAPMPPAVEEIDLLVRKAEPKHKQVLIVFYAQSGYLIEKARRLEMDRWKFKRILGNAQSYIESNL